MALSTIGTNSIADDAVTSAKSAMGLVKISTTTVSSSAATV